MLITTFYPEHLKSLTKTFLPGDSKCMAVAQSFQHFLRSVTHSSVAKTALLPKWLCIIMTIIMLVILQTHQNYSYELVRDAK